MSKPNQSEVAFYVLQPDNSPHEYGIEVVQLRTGDEVDGYDLWCNGRHLNEGEIMYTDNDEIPTAEQVKAFLVEIQSEPED